MVVFAILLAKPPKRRAISTNLTTTFPSTNTLRKDDDFSQEGSKEPNASSLLIIMIS
jgi:hypothetical protein